VHLTGLQHLQLSRLCEHTDPPEAGLLAFEESLGQLQQLTCLVLSSKHTIGGAMATASSLSQLQELKLFRIGTAEQPLQMQWVPSSLTSVELSSCTVSCAPVGSGSSSGGGWKLPVLERLELVEEVGGFEPAAEAAAAAA
jgi:hypothetical protein